MGNLINELKDRSENANRQSEIGLVNPSTGSSLTLDSSGNVNIAASRLVQYKLNKSSGYAKEISLESETMTNRKRITADEMIVNNHKFNPQFYELTDMKVLNGDSQYCIGNLTVEATVLVKTWEPNLKKWVLIRRPMRTPMFLNSLPIASAPSDMDIDDDILKEIEITNDSGKE